jgi:hypothetical protein
MNAGSVLIENLLSVPVLVFALGLFAAVFRGDVRLPDPVYQAISIFLLFGIGLKGGHSIKGVEVKDFAIPAMSTILLGALIPFLAFYILKFFTSFNRADRGAIAAHYGSTSLVTFSAAMLFLDNSGIFIEPYATALLTIMEIPGIIVGIYLGSRHAESLVHWGETLREVITGKTIALLVGGLIVGAVASDNGYERVSPFFIDIQYGVLTLFLLHLGFLAGSNWSQIRSVGLQIGLFAILFPIAMGALGVAVGSAIGLSIGGATILGALSASASYIAAPAAVSLGLPKANGSLALISSIGLTFPFNLIIGIPLYLEMAQLLIG